MTRGKGLKKVTFLMHNQTLNVDILLAKTSSLPTPSVLLDRNRILETFKASLEQSKRRAPAYSQAERCVRAV